MCQQQSKTYKTMQKKDNVIPLKDPNFPVTDLKATEEENVRWRF